MFINNANIEYISTNNRQTKSNYRIDIYDRLFYHYASTNYIPEVKIEIKNEVLEVKVDFEVIHNYHLPLNHFVINVSSTLGDFNNIPVKELTSQSYQTNLSLPTAKKTLYTSSMRIDLRKVNLVNKPVYKKRLNFSFNIAVNPHVINSDVKTSTVFDWAVFTHQLNIRWSKANASYLYSNFFDISEINNEEEVAANESYSDLWWDHDNDIDHRTLRLTKNKAVTKLPWISYLSHYQPAEMRIALREVAYELTYWNLANEQKSLKWTHAQLNLERMVKNIYIELEIDKGMVYDFIKDELVFDERASKQIWLPKKQKARLKVFLITNYSTTKNHYIEFILNFTNDFTTLNKPIIKVFKAEIDDYENFKEVK
ncbi:hypothetical protein [Ureaplasma diversum]|uniref:Uncharacterized protein n=1 Tax=Ureaplasma diversum NCTC 246 TaxID=1188241 RepID=A0A084EZM6_9BACT|nr:hypothetical protein [Ureaplasma diversum]KEZ23418.1 hypothetical protein UDIV_3180 [Ureaplasma diversum NCTC 246]